MDANGNFEVLEKAGALGLGAHGVVTDGPGEAATGGGSNAGAHAIAAGECATDGAAVDSSGGAAQGPIGTSGPTAVSLIRF